MLISLNRALSLSIVHFTAASAYRNMVCDKCPCFRKNALHVMVAQLLANRVGYFIDTVRVGQLVAVVSDPEQIDRLSTRARVDRCAVNYQLAVSQGLAQT